MSFKKFILISAGAIVSLFFIYQISVLVALSATAPTVTFSGDDLLKNGGTDDAYDAVIAVDITASQAAPTAWELGYSTDAGQTWSAVLANYIVITPKQRRYHWSVSKIFAPTLLFRARTQLGTEWSDYFQASLKLSHRATNHDAHYFVESFNNDDFKSSGTTANWDTTRALVELSPNPPFYHPNSLAYSTNLLAGVGNSNVISVAFQPVQWDFTFGAVEYQFSNDGSTWYGDTSGVPQPGGMGGTWFNFPAQLVPDAVTVPFTGSSGAGLYFRVRLATNNTSFTPQLYQLRFQWQENTTPQACFIVDPVRSDDPGQVFSFNANCSADYEESLANLSFRWDWENDGSFDTVWQAGFSGYIKTHIFNSTSTFVINLEVKDSYNLTDSFQNSVNNDTGVEGDVFGWAWSSNYGWISLNCDNTYFGALVDNCPPNYGWTLNADYTLSGWAWDDNLGWLCLGATCSAYGDDPYGSPPQAVYSRVTGEVAGWGKYLIFGDNGWLQLRGNWCDATPPDDACVHVNLSRRTLEGWGFSGGVESGSLVGAGWLEFSGNINVPWLETKYGSVYGRGNIGSSQTAMPPSDRYSSTYCILSSGSIINFTSESGCLETPYADLGFPNVSEKYRTILGVIDFERILNGEQTTIASADIDVNLPKTLGGKVYHFTGQASYVIDNPLTFFNAKNLNSSGAGTVVVDGDLIIRSNLYYESAPVAGQIENLASVAWIVKGDVIIDPAVTQTVGAFIVLGKDGVACPASGCGQFKTGNDSANPKQLVVQGLAMAKQFIFERFYKVGEEPAESVVYDGRVLVNIPPGLEDVAKGLPVWREAYSTLQIE